MTGYKLRHVPTGTLMHHPFASATSAVIFAEETAGLSAADFTPEPIVLPCSCGKDYVRMRRATPRFAAAGFAWCCPACRTPLEAA